MAAGWSATDSRSVATTNTFNIQTGPFDRLRDQLTTASPTIVKAIALLRRGERSRTVLSANHGNSVCEFCNGMYKTGFISFHPFQVKISLIFF